MVSPNNSDQTQFKNSGNDMTAQVPLSRSGNKPIGGLNTKIFEDLTNALNKATTVFTTHCEAKEG